MKQLLPLVTFLLVCDALFGQTAPTQSSTTPAAATDNAVKTQPPPPSTATDNAVRTPTSGAGAEPAKPEAVSAGNPPVVDPASTPTVKKFPEVHDENVDPRIAAPSLPKKNVTLIGGTVREIDPIRDRMTVDIYGGHQLKLIFDQRTKVTRNGAEVNPVIIRKGDRVYLDTQQLHDKVFAKQIQIVTKMEAADIGGQVISFDPNTRELELRDNLSARPFRFILDHDAAITANGGKAATIANLQPGALVTAHFNAGPRGRGTIRDINVLAAPGEEFTLYGTVNHLDLRSGTIAIQNRADDKAYEVRFSPSELQADDLAMGAEVAVTTRFDGRDYIAQSLNVTSPAGASKIDSDEGAEANKTDKDTATKDKKHEKKEKKDKTDEKEQEDDSNPK